MTPNADSKPKMLFVDDRSERIHAALRQYAKSYEVVIAPNVPEALRLMSKHDWSIISLDFDLDGNDYSDPQSRTCGMEIVRHLLMWPERDKGLPDIVIHSSNLFGAEIMYRTLRDRFGSSLITKIPFQHE